MAKKCDILKHNTVTEYKNESDMKMSNGNFYFLGIDINDFNVGDRLNILDCVGDNYNKNSYIVCKKKDHLYYNEIQTLTINYGKYVNRVINVWIDVLTSSEYDDPIKEFIHLIDLTDLKNGFIGLQRIYLTNKHIKMIKEQFNLDIKTKNGHKLYYDCQRNKFYSYECNTEYSCRDLIFHQRCNEFNIKEYCPINGCKKLTSKNDLEEYYSRDIKLEK